MREIGTRATCILLSYTRKLIHLPCSSEVGLLITCGGKGYLQSKSQSSTALISVIIRRKMNRKQDGEIIPLITSLFSPMIKTGSVLVGTQVLRQCWDAISRSLAKSAIKAGNSCLPGKVWCHPPAMGSLSRT